MIIVIEHVCDSLNGYLGPQIVLANDCRMEINFEHNKLSLRGCSIVPSSCCPTSTNHLYALKLVLHQQSYDEASPNLKLKIESLLIELSLL